MSILSQRVPKSLAEPESREERIEAFTKAAQAMKSGKAVDPKIGRILGCALHTWLTSADRSLQHLLKIDRREFSRKK